MPKIQILNDEFILIDTVRIRKSKINCYEPMIKNDDDMKGYIVRMIIDGYQRDFFDFEKADNEASTNKLDDILELHFK